MAEHAQAGSATRPNRLIDETSPYLRQHAHNPVDWHPWGAEALERAKRENKPIFLSIGYSACHWCHVMEHESFEDPQIAAVMNEHFVNIKVDREERPDLDQIYMNAVQMMTGHGGWPMSVFLTPDLEPFYGGTYFPPDDRTGMPGFKRVLLGVAQAWRERQGEVKQSAGELTANLRRVCAADGEGGELNHGLIDRAEKVLARLFDRTYGGFGGAPKFPHAMDLRLLLRQWKRTGSEDALHIVRVTLDKMAAGGIYDHLGGGFHRYSTDARWLVPHFEKMLYDNALLAQTYLEAYQATVDEDYRRVVEETLDYVLREMTAPEGGFYSAQDADSEGVEGKYFVWTRQEVVEALGPELAELFCYVYDVSDVGNWEHTNILNRAKTPAQNAKLLGVSEMDLHEKLAVARRKLSEVRSRRVPPGRDEKVLTSWNGLMIAAMAQAGAVLGAPRFAQAAGAAARFIWEQMRDGRGRLLHSFKDGQARLGAYLDDYSYLIDALLSLYEADFEPLWIGRALELSEILIDQFWDAEQGGFFYTARDHETLVARPKDFHDSSTPSGNSAAATALLRLAKLTGRQDLWAKAEATLRRSAGLLAESPTSAGQMLIALDFYLGRATEIAVVGGPAAAETQSIVNQLRRRFIPNKVLALKPAPATGAPGQPVDLDRLLPLLADKTAVDGRPTVYVCENFTCQAPIVGAEAIEEAIGAM